MTTKTTGAILIFLIFIFFFLGLGGYDLAAPDEPRFALVAHEMLTDNHWVLPHRNQNPYPDKPPFFFWTIAFFSTLAGGTVNAWTSRLPTAVAATLILWIMWRWSKTDDKNNYRPILTVLILMSCSKFFFQARIAQIDMMLCLFTTAAITMGYQALTNQAFNAFWLGIFMGIGILTKGPVGYLVPAGAMALFAGISGRAGWRNFPLKSLAWALVPVFVWLGLLVVDVALNNHWDYLNNLLFKQTLVRYFNAWHHHQPFYYFFVNFLIDFLPWTPFFVLAIPFTRKDWQTLESKQKYSWVVIVFTLIFFSLSKGKRSIYILPLFPFAAYVTAVKLEWLILKKNLSVWEKTSGLIAGVLILFLGLALLIAVSGWVDLPTGWVEAPLPNTWIAIAGVLLTATAVLILVSVIRIKLKQMITGIVVAMMVANILLFSVILPWLDPFRSARGFVEEMNRIVASHLEKSGKEPVVGMVDFRAAYRLYGNYPIVELSTEYGFPNPDLPKIGNFFEKYPQGWLIVRENDWEAFIKEHSFKAIIYIEQKIGSGKNYLLLTKDETK